jgi:hypothetical protein
LSPPLNTLIRYPTDATDLGYKTYSTKFKFVDDFTNNLKNTCSGGLFFNMGSSLSGTHFVELIRVNVGDPSISAINYLYYLVISKIDTKKTLIAYANVTGIMSIITNNFEKLYYKDNDIYYLYNDPRESFHMRFTLYPFDHSQDGEGAPGRINSQRKWTIIFSVYK